MTATARRFFSGRIATVICILALIAAKFWLIHSEEISGSATRYDALWFVRSARDWYWGAKYDWIAFIRPAAYPLFLALMRFIGLRLRIAIEVLQLSGFLFLLFALRRAGLPRAFCLIAFAFACFHPDGFQLNNYTLADTFYAGVLPFVLGGMIWLMVNGEIFCAIGTGFALAVLWNTREESFLVTLLILAFVAISILRRQKMILWLTMLAVFAALNLAVYAANLYVYRAFAKSDMTAPSFESLFNALNRIEAKTAQRYIPIPAESLRAADRVSPTFARLKPQLNGAVGRDWREETMKRLGIPNEIGVNWLLWALREAANRAGFHSDAKTAARFYRTSAREINAACNDGRLPTRFVWASFIGPVFFQNAHYLPVSLGRVLKVFVAPYEMTRDRNDFILTAQERALYDEMTLRRPAAAMQYDPFEKAMRVENFIGANYRWLVYLLGALGLLAGIILLMQWRKLSLDDALWSAFALGFFAIATRILLFTLLTAMAWPSDYDRFLFPVMPLANIFLVVLIYRGMAALRRAR